MKDKSKKKLSFTHLLIFLFSSFIYILVDEILGYTIYNSTTNVVQLLSADGQKHSRNRKSATGHRSQFSGLPGLKMMSVFIYIFNCIFYVELLEGKNIKLPEQGQQRIS